MIERQRNKYRFPDFDDAIFYPPKYIILNAVKLV